MTTDVLGNDGPYSEGRTSAENRLVLEALTSPPHWDCSRLRGTLIALGCLGKDFQIPAFNRPDSINISGWEDDLRRLRVRTDRSGREAGYPILVDKRKRCLIIAPTTDAREEDGESRVLIYINHQPGRGLFQEHVILVHDHGDRGTILSGGFSDTDYATLLNDKCLKGSLMIWKKARFLALKTSVTPNNLRPERVKEKVDDLAREFLTREEGVIDFNKAVCLEFGLTLYYAGNGENCLRRTEVTK